MADPFWSNIFRGKHDDDSLLHFLKGQPIFAGLSAKELKLLEVALHQRSYQPNEIVFEEGDPGSGMYMIRSGGVRILGRRVDSGEEVLAELGPGDFFGETTLTAPAPRTATARTVEATELVGLFRSDLLELAERYATLTRNILFGLTRVVSERLQTASHEIRRLQHQLGEHASAENVET
ncbi:MAG: cyclic nucleotide-binding domain-containing protein [Desulfuromonadales bacterium]|nr:cyclic nucleotide-binding domain-containing protein [Desulfuromonadales bacterium]